MVDALVGGVQLVRGVGAWEGHLGHAWCCCHPHHAHAPLLGAPALRPPAPATLRGPPLRSGVHPPCASTPAPLTCQLAPPPPQVLEALDKVSQRLVASPDTVHKEFNRADYNR